MNKKPLMIGAFLASIVVLIIAASGPIQHVLVDNATLSIAGNVGITNATVTDVNVTNTVTVTGTMTATNDIPVTGWPLLVTNITITNYTGTDLVANDSMGPGNWEINGVARTANGKALLLGATYGRTTNSTADCIDVYITDRPITFPAASTAVNIDVSSLTNILGVLRFGTNGANADIGKPWQVIGTNMVCSQYLTMGLKPATNSIFLYRTTITATTNLLSDYLTLTIQNE